MRLDKTQGKDGDKDERAHIHANAKVRVDKYGQPGTERAQRIVDGKIYAVGHVFRGKAYAVHHSGKCCVDKDKACSHPEDGEKERKGSVEKQKEQACDEDGNARAYGMHFAVQNLQDTLGEDAKHGAEKGRRIEQAHYEGTDIGKQFAQMKGSQVEDRGMGEDAQGPYTHECQKMGLAYDLEDMPWRKDIVLQGRTFGQAAHEGKRSEQKDSMHDKDSIKVQGVCHKA